MAWGQGPIGMVVWNEAQQIKIIKKIGPVGFWLPEIFDFKILMK